MKITMMMLGSMLALPLLADTWTDKTTGYTWEYEGDANGVVLEGVSPSLSGDVTLPSKINGFPVQVIAGSSFYGNKALRSVVIPEGVSVIEGYAFWTCTLLDTVVIPASVESIGFYAFAHCPLLSSVYFCGDCPDCDRHVFNGSSMYDSDDSSRLTIYVKKGTTGWDASKVVYYDALPVEKDTPTPSDSDDDDTPTPTPSDPDDDDTPTPIHSDFELITGFDGSSSHTFNGLVYDSEDVMCGMAQITTAKATAKGVKVGGFVILSDGKKQTIKSTTGTVSGGYLTATTSVGKLGSMEITIGGNGFKGTLGDMTLATEETDEDTGVLSGTLKMSYFDAKTGKIKTKSITIGGVASGGEAIGTATVKGQAAKSFAAEVE